MPNLFYSFTTFLKSPTPQPTTSYNQKIIGSLRLWFLAILISIFGAIIATNVLLTFQYNPEEHRITQLFNESNFFLILFFGSLWAPITEELTFRLFLKKSKLNWKIGLTFIFTTITFLLLEIIPGLSDHIPETRSLTDLIFKILIYIAVLAIYALTANTIINRLPQAKITRLWKQHFAKIFYLTAIIFALVHLINFENITNLILLSPLLIIPQFAIGVILGYIRIQYGFIYAILIHIIHNLSLSLFTISSLNLQSEALDKINSGTDLTFTESTSLYILSLLLIFFFLGLTTTIALFIRDILKQPTNAPTASKGN